MIGKEVDLDCSVQINSGSDFSKNPLNVEVFLAPGVSSVPSQETLLSLVSSEFFRMINSGASLHVAPCCSFLMALRKAKSEVISYVWCAAHSRFEGIIQPYILLLLTLYDHRESIYVLGSLERVRGLVFTWKRDSKVFTSTMIEMQSFSAKWEVDQCPDFGLDAFIHGVSCYFLLFAVSAPMAQ